MISKTKYLTSISATSNIEHFLKITFGILALFASNQLAIPIKPVPITLFTVTVTLIGFIYTPQQAIITIGAYVLGGVAGLSLFSNLNGGLSYFLGMSGGYLVGAIFAAPIIAVIKAKFENNIYSSILASLVGHIIIYLFGVSWLATFIGYSSAIYHGLLIYIPSGIIKILVFSSLYSYLTNHKTLG